MADRIRVDTDVLDAMIAKLRQLTSELGSTAAETRQLRPSRASGGEVRMNLSLNTRTVSGRVNGDTVSEILQSMGGIMDSLNSYADKLAAGIRENEIDWSEGERKIASFVTGTGESAPYTAGASSSTASGSGDLERDAAVRHAILTVLAYPEDESLWTQDMRDKYEEYIQKSFIFYEDGQVGLIHMDGGKISKIFAVGDLVICNSTDTGVTHYSVTSESWDNCTYSREKGKSAMQFLSGKYKLDSPKRDKGYEDRSVWVDGEKSEKGNANPFKNRVSLVTVKESFETDNRDWYKKVSYENGKFSSDASISIGNTHSFSEGEAGFFAVEVDENGNKQYKFSPGARYKAGISYNALQIDGSAEYEIMDGVKAEGKGQLKFFNFEADGEVQVGLIDGKPSMYAGVGGKATFVEGTINGDLNIGNDAVKIGASATAEIGLDAHAKVGLKDGKVTVDVGLAFGVGASAQLEIDASGMIESVTSWLGDTAERVGKGMTGLTKNAPSVWNML